MAKLPVATDKDPTLEASDAELARIENAKGPRPYLGMSEIGVECDRRLFLNFRKATPSNFDAVTVKRFESGHRAEALQAERLRLIPTLELHTVDENGEQFEFADFGGHFKGHSDGAIKGILQAPRTWHVWEHKETDEKKLNKLLTCKVTYGEKSALEQWDGVYYAQAIMYMEYMGLERHYLTNSMAGVRHTISVRTNSDKDAAIRLKARARNIIFAEQAPERISKKPDFYQCKFCDHRENCHTKEPPSWQRGCRTCLHVTPREDGAWHCARHDKTLTFAEQLEGCPSHLYNPSIVNGVQIDASQKDEWVEYQMKDGNTWRDE